MPYEQRDNSGAAFYIDADKKRDKGPSYDGKGMIHGKMGYLAVWPKKDKNGKTFLTWRWNDYEPKGGQSAPVRRTQEDRQAEGEDVPF